MQVNGLRIPEDLVRMLASGRLRWARGSLPLVREVDAYGHPLETELGQVHAECARMRSATASLTRDFVPDGVYGSGELPLGAPGAIPDIVDFGQIVCFAESGDGAPFCLDYRDAAAPPCVIWWSDDHWRRVAPDMASFLALFVLP